MAFGRSRILALAGMVFSALVFMGAPARANAVFDYNLVQTSGTTAVTGTLEIELVGGTTLTYTPYTNVPLADVLSVTFIVNGITFDLSNGAITALQFTDTAGTLRDITYSGVNAGNALFTTGGFVFDPSGGGQDFGDFRFLSSRLVPVPEPASWMMLIFGLALLLFVPVARRRRATAAAKRPA